MPIRHENLTRPAIKQFLDALPDLLLADPSEGGINQTEEVLKVFK